MTTHGFCSNCLKEMLNKQLGLPVRVDNGMFCGTGKRLVFLGELPKGSVRSLEVGQP